MAFLRAKNQSAITKPPNRKSSQELINEVFMRSKNIDYNYPSSITSPTSNNGISNIEGLLDYSKQNNKPIKAEQAKSAANMNENGLLKIILNRVDQEKRKQINKVLDKIAKDKK